MTDPTDTAQGKGTAKLSICAVCNLPIGKAPIAITKDGVIHRNCFTTHPGKGDKRQQAINFFEAMSQDIANADPEELYRDAKEDNPNLDAELEATRKSMLAVIEKHKKGSANGRKCF